MKVRLKIDVSGTRNGAPWPARGEIVELPDQEAADMCANGQADPVAEKASDKAEKAVAPEAEQRSGLTTEDGPTRRGPGRPRKAEE